MSTDMSNAEQEIPRPREEQVAKRWLKMRGVTPPQEAEPAGFLDKLKEAVGLKGKAPQAPEQLVGQAYDLFVEKQDLKDDIVAKQREVMEPATFSQPLSLEEKKKLIRHGRISALLTTAGEEALPYKEVIGKSQARIGEIDNQLDQVFTAPGIYDRFVQNLTHQVRVRHQAREARSLDRFVENTDLVSVRLTREGQVQGRTLTSVEQSVVRDNRTLREEAEKRKAELLKDPDVFDRVRIMTLKEYQQQLREDNFAETPSRTELIEKIEDAWKNGEKVLLTGHTGTGKTQVYAYASRKLYGEDPEVIPGNEDIGYYQIVGAVGFEKDKDVPRSGSLVQAMTGRNGKGKPWLIDEITRIPGRQVASAKWLFGLRPGTKNIKPYPNQPLIVDVGTDYSGGATANIKHAEHGYQVYELDPAITREFTQPVRVDYIPAWEVYDLTLATLMDRRGGIPLSEKEARTLLKDLCDVAGATQQGFQGKKMIVGDTAIEDRRDASTGKTPSLKKAVLDPGWVLKIMKGWSGAMGKGITFESYLQERVLEYINNEDYPDNDRYYLTRIFALKGLLNGRTANEFFVSGLTDEVLSRWSGGKAGVKSESGKKATEKHYLSPDRVARLDPYRRLKRPVSAEAEELLEEEVPEAVEVAEAGGPMVERAKEVLGRDFLGVEAIKKLEQELKKVGVNVEFALDKLPPFLYTEEDLQTAKAFGEMLVLRPEAMLRGGREVPLTMIEFRELFRKDPLGKMQTVVYSFRTDTNDWYKGEKFATGAGEIKLGWSLVKKDVLDGSTNTNWNDQEQLLRQYEAGLKRKGAKNASVKRRTGTEAVYDELIYYVNTGERLLPYKYDWTQTRTSGGRLVFVGCFDSHGLSVYNCSPEPSNSNIGVCPSR